jgi:RiboL-PSP-HEPN
LANPAIVRLRARLSDAARLIEIHEECTGNAAGRRRGYDALNRSTTLLAVAAWESFVEALLEDAVGRIARHLEGPTELPANVRDAMVAYLYEAEGWSKLNNGTKTSIWKLAGRGWRTAYIGYAKSKISALNTPNHINVKKLYSTVLGLQDFTIGWGARRWTAQAYITKLDDLLTLRHRIAHGSIGDETVGKTKARDAVALVERIAGWTTRTVEAHLKRLDVRPKGVRVRVRKRPAA